MQSEISMSDVPIGLTIIHFPQTVDSILYDECERLMEQGRELEFPYFFMRNMFRFTYNDYLVDAYVSELDFVEAYNRDNSTQGNMEDLALSIIPELRSIDRNLEEFVKYHKQHLWNEDFRYDHPVCEGYGHRVFDRSTVDLFENEDANSRSYASIKTAGNGVLYLEDDLRQAMEYIAYALEKRFNQHEQYNE